MPNIAFRMYINNVSATREQLDRIERIVVTQEMDMLWEAEVSTHTVLDAGGTWLHRADEFPPLTRVRIELTHDGALWTPLIEGPIVRSNSAMDASPGSSEVTFIVRDDSVFLNRHQSAHVYHYQTERSIIDTVLSEYQAEPGTTTQFTPDIAAIPSDVPRDAARRQTPMQFLRMLAHQRGWHAYVLPSATLGQPSSFCYKPKARTVTGLAPLKLSGDDRTLQVFHVEANPEGPQNTSAARIDYSNGQIVVAQSSSSAQELMAAQAATDEPAERLADPRHGTTLAPDVSADAHTATSMYAFKATGRLVPFRYNAVLTPYQVVGIQAGSTSNSANYLLRKVTHTLTRHLYTQEFEALGDSISIPGAAASPASTIV